MSLASLQSQIISCRLCPRLVSWREKVAHEKVRRFEDERYWGRPVPGFGDPEARLLIVGLAPAAHGANRTGRMFTGDRSGEYLYRALFKAGFSSQAESTNRNDGLRLSDCYITAAVRCAPPGNKPAPEEFRNCRPYLLEEISQLNRVHVVLGLGKIGFDTALAAVTTARDIAFVSRPKFAHGAVYQVGDVHFVCSYHPSQQNTFTGRLTEPMFDEVFRRIRRLLQ